MGFPVTTATADPPPDGRRQVRSPWAIARAAVVAPFTRRQRRELLFCLAGLPFAVVNPLVLVVLTMDLIWFAAGSGHGNPSPAQIAIAAAGQGLLLVLLVSTTAARRLRSPPGPPPDPTARLAAAHARDPTARDASGSAAGAADLARSGRARPGSSRRRRLAGRGLP